MKNPTAKAPATTRDASPLWVFTPSRTNPKDLELILVQRQHLLKDAVERVRESALTDNKHHLLFVGPHGCGKTHLVTLLVSRLNADPELAGRLCIAWLNEDDTCTTLLEFLVKIQDALASRHPAEDTEMTLREAYNLRPEDALHYVRQQLLAALGNRTLLIVVENLDAIFEGLGDAGQKGLRSFIQEHPRFAIVATAQRLLEDLSSRAKPFFGFFQTEHLEPLNANQAGELLRKIARLREDQEMAEFLSTDRGQARVRALHHLTGGNHRVFIVLAQYLTRASLDTLQSPFMKMVDELTPYYRGRIRGLPPLQRKIVECLGSGEGTLPVKEIARRLFASPQTISSQLQELRQKGYATASQRGRESLYTISEPLLHTCVAVKDTQSLQPVQLLVDLVRVWYEDPEKDPAPDRALLHFGEGQWREGFADLASGLAGSDSTGLRSVTRAAKLAGAVFAAGLSAEGRGEKTRQLFQIYERARLLPVLGGGLVRHLGQIHRAGTPGPTEDNLESWASAWETAAAGVPEFRLAFRLLRTGANFLKAGGKDTANLLDLTATERAILLQAFGLGD